MYTTNIIKQGLTLYNACFIENIKPVISDYITASSAIKSDLVSDSNASTVSLSLFLVFFLSLTRF